MPLAEWWALWQEAMRSKVLKVLNFSGAGESNIFNFTFTGGAAEGPDPAALGRSPRGDSDVRLLTSQLSKNTNPAFEAGHVREGEGVERSRVPWVLGGRRGVGDDALCWFLRRRPRAGFMPGPVRPRRVWIGNCRTGDRVDPFAP